ALAAKLANDTDQYYILLMKGVIIVIEIIPKHASYNPKEDCYLELKKKIGTYLQDLEMLKKTVNERHTEWVSKSQIAAAATVPTPAPIPTSNSILSPTVSSSSISSTSISSRVNALKVSDPSSAAPFVPQQATNQPNNAVTVAAATTYATPSTSATTDALMARLKALQPGANITLPSSNSSAPRQQQHLPLPKQSSSFTDTNNNATNSRPITPLNVPLAPTSQTSRSPSNADLLQNPPQLTRSKSGSNGGSSGGSRTLKDLKMTAAELHAGLLSIPQGSKTKVLIVDVRPMEDYIQGHIRWPDASAKSSKSGEITSGLVHVEPDWVHPGFVFRFWCLFGLYWISDLFLSVDTDHIVHCLRGFTSPEDPRLMMFDYRNTYEVIVLYDASSSSYINSPVLTNLISALYLGENNASRILSRQPIVLDGGFMSWVEFCKRKNLHLGNWVEIGEGVGGGGIPVGVDGVSGGSSSAGVSPVPGHAVLPGQSSSGGQKPIVSSAVGGGGQQHQQQQYSNQYSAMPQYSNPKVSQYAPPNQYFPNQANMGTVGTGLYGTEPSRRSSYLQFENPFMNFSNTGVGGPGYTSYSAGYPRLPGQVGVSPNFSRQTSFTGGPAEYPSLTPLTSNIPVGGTSTPPVVPQKPSNMTVSPQQQQFPSAIPQQQQQSPAHALQHQQSQARLQQQLQQQGYQQQQYQQQQQQYLQQQISPSLAQQPLQQQPQQVPPTTPAKPTSLALQQQQPPPLPIVKMLPPPIPSKPRLSITSVELTQTSPAYSNPDDFISISTLGSSIGVVGLKNLGNTCFMNSTLQCLSGTVPLARYFLGGNYRKGINRSNPMGTKGVIAEEFSQVIKSMWSGQESIITPSQFKERVGEYASQFKGTDQHDSQEFLGFLLDAVHEDLNIARGATRKEIDMKGQEDESIPDDIRLQMAWNNYRSQNWSIIVDLFQGQLKSKLECLTCHTTSTTFNPFMYLSLPIPSKNAAGVTNGPVYLDECLDKFVEMEILDGEDAWNCSKCKVKRRTRKTMTIAKLPPILLVHLKRFYYQGPFKSKLETYVDFPLASMDLGKYVASAAPGSQVYDLYAVSNHTGSLGSGHYTATVHNNSKKAWYNFSDTRVGVCDVNALKSNSAYILFYVRKASPSVQMTNTDWWK
ncbi:UNVERIFIED_CONTAM: ubiquitin-specific protease doa4, partial [Siphonaria sp. JEL0065]